VTFAFEPVVGWPNLPYGMSFGSEATAVTVDQDDNVIVFCRGPVPVFVFNRDGAFVDSWGADEFGMAHAANVDGAGDLWLTDMRHVIEKRSIEGKPLLTLGERGRRAPAYSGEPFNIPTDVAEHPVTGELFVTDGYRNAAVHRFSPDGRHLASFGAPGTDAGDLAVPHGIAFLDDERLVVCDRENWRLQVFDLDGEPLAEWHAYFPQAVRAVRDPGGELRIYVGEGPATTYMRGAPRFGSRVAIFDEQGRRIATVGAGGWGFEPDRFTSIHGIAVDSVGDLYVAETPHAVLERFYREPVPAGELVSLRKWRRVDVA
jgi:hypothetical protein